MTPSRAQPDLSTYAGRFGAHIRAIREKKKLTQLNAAKSIGISSSTLSLWESGMRFPDVENLPILANTLKLKHVRDLFPD